MMQINRDPRAALAPLRNSNFFQLQCGRALEVGQVRDFQANQVLTDKGYEFSKSEDYEWESNKLKTNKGPSINDLIEKSTPSPFSSILTSTQNISGVIISDDPPLSRFFPRNKGGSSGGFKIFETLRELFE